VRNQIKAIGKNTNKPSINAAIELKLQLYKLNQLQFVGQHSIHSIELMLSHSHSNSPFISIAAPTKKPIYLVANSINQRLLCHAHSS